MPNIRGVTDHFLLRYIERVHGVDMQKLREHILTDKMKLALHSGAKSVTSNGYRYIIEDGQFITVYKKG
jgi:hypothetical protein